MKAHAPSLTTILTALTCASVTFASAQTQIGSVTLTRPTAPAPTLQQQRSAPAQPARRVAPVRTQTASSLKLEDVPAGSQEIQGRVLAAAGTVSLPAGSTVNVTVNDLTRPAQVAQISFRTSRLSTPYQMVFSSARLNSAHTYAVQAKVVDAGGKTLYTSDASAVLPGTRHANVNVTVR